MATVIERGKFGIGKFQPECLQRLACVEVFSVFIAIYGFVVGILPMYTVSQLTAIEKDFGLKSQMSGTILASSELGFIASALILGHFLSLSHRPRIIGVCALLTSFSCFLMTTPFFEHMSRRQRRSDVTTSPAAGSDTADVILCGNRPQCKGVVEPEMEEIAYRMFIACTIISGIGSTSFYTLGISYVDDNSPKKMAPKYIGYIFGMRYIAPAIGLLLGGGTSTVPVHLDYSTTAAGVEWIGAWWMGYYVIGMLALLAGIPMLFFPKMMRKVRKEKHPAVEMPATEKTDDDGTKTGDKLSRSNSQPKRKRKFSVVETIDTTKGLIKDFPKALWRLVSNLAFVLLALSMTADICGMVGYVAFAPKYVETQFDASPSHANLLVGLVIPAATTAIILSGKIMSLSKRPLHQKVLVTVIGYFISYASFPVLLPFRCDSVTIQGWNTTYGDSDLLQSCNTQCACAEVDFSAVCGSDGVTYYSTCHAGCTDFSNGVYSNCACIKTTTGLGTATAGHCPSQCPESNTYAYAGIQFLINFFSTLVTMPVIMLSLRVIKPRDKSLALAVINVIASCFIFPTPIAFGTLIDSACTVSFPESDCSTTGGACAYYDNDKFRVEFHIAGTLVKLMSPLLLFGSWLASRKMDLNDEEPAERNEEAQEAIET